MFPVGLAPVPGWSHSAQSIFFFFFFQELSLVFPSQSRIWLTGYNHEHWSPTTVPGRVVWMKSVLHVAPNSTCSRILVIHSQHLNSPSRRNYSPSSSHCFHLSTLLTCLVVGFFKRFYFILDFFFLFFLPASYLRKHKEPSQRDSPQWRDAMKWCEAGCRMIPARYERR